jgi:hypothetical protein
MIEDADRRWHGLTQQAEGWIMMHRQKQPAEREAVLDQILTNLWKGKLTRDAAVGRIMAKLGMGQRAAQDEVDGFLQD